MNEYYGQIAADYAAHRRVHPEVLRQLLTEVPIQPGTRVLEVGCGTGNYIIALRERADCAAWGIDPSEQMLAQAQARRTAVTFQRGKAEELGMPPDSFDFVFSVDVIHHVGDRAKAFAESCRALCPGGKICVVTDSEEILRTRQPLSVYFPETVAVELARYPRIETLRQEMRDAGFCQLRETNAELVTQLSNIDSYRARVYSSLAKISDDAFARGIARLEQALRSGPVPAISRYVMLWGTKQYPCS